MRQNIFVTVLYGVYLLSLIRVSNSAKKINIVANCIAATKALGQGGDGSTPSSCIGCDPTYGTCYFNCQPLVAAVYLYCADGCLPDGYSYDPKMSITGCWETAKPLVKIGVERCGCNSAASAFMNILPLFVIVTGTVLVLYFG